MSGESAPKPASKPEPSTAEGEIRAVLRHLEEDYTEPVRDPLWQHIYLSPALEAVTALPVFRKLDRIKQLGPSHMVYPGATHTRLSHSLGVFHLSRRIISRLVRQPGCPPLSLEGVKAFLTAALLHDLGHFPYAHSLKELPLPEHEELTGRLILQDPLAAVIRDRVGTPPEAAAAIVDLGFPLQQLPRPLRKEIPFFRNILSGVLDPDKLDYLNRDAYFCGVPYGIQDLEFVISQAVPHPQKGLAITEKGLSAVENILFSKFLMYKSVYWHPTVRTITAVMKKGVFTALQDGLIRPKELCGLDDRQLTDLFAPDSSTDTPGGAAGPVEPHGPVGPGPVPADHPAAQLIQAARRPGAYRAAAEWPFDPANPQQAQLFTLEERTRREALLARRLTAYTGSPVSPGQVVLEVSPPISFEADLPLRTAEGWINFPQSATVFRRPVVRGFTENLRRIMLILPAPLAAEVQHHPHPQSLLDPQQELDL